MQASSGQLTEPALRTLLAGATLAGTWVLDPRRSSIRLKTTALGLFRVNGVFGEASGQGTVSADGTVSGALSVAAASIDTRNAKRDTHLRSADIFDSDHHPYITFTVDGIWPSGQGITAAGTLTVRGRSRPLSFDAVATVPDNGEIWLDAEARIDRTSFGLTWTGASTSSKTSIMIVHTVFARG
jgi:polyisoprenoid-binding protein YceI